MCLKKKMWSNDGNDGFLGAFGNISEKKFNDIGDNQGEKVDFD